LYDLRRNQEGLWNGLIEESHDEKRSAWREQQNIEKIAKRTSESADDESERNVGSGAEESEM